MDIPRIRPEDAKALLDQGKAAFLDSRSPDAWSESDWTLPQAVRMPPDEIEPHLSELPAAPVYVAACT